MLDEHELQKTYIINNYFYFIHFYLDYRYNLDLDLALYVSSQFSLVQVRVLDWGETVVEIKQFN